MKTIMVLIFMKSHTGMKVIMDHTEDAYLVTKSQIEEFALEVVTESFKRAFGAMQNTDSGTQYIMKTVEEFINRINPVS